MKESLLEENILETSARKAELNSILTKIEESVRKNAHYLEDFTVYSGFLGACIFYCYYAKFTDNDDYFKRADSYLDKALEKVDYKYFKRIYPTDSYDANIAGLGIFLKRATENGLLDFDVSPYLEKIEDTLHGLCKNKIKHADFSIFSGALATGNYLLIAEKSERNDQLIIEIVESIEANAKKDADGGIYWTSPRLNDKVYLGLSHGSCMIISFLSAVFERGLLRDKCRVLIEQASAFVLKCKRDKPKGLFPHVLGEEVADTQFSLCYGDLGVGYGLLKGGLTIQDDNLIYEAKNVLKICLARRYEDKLTYDSGMIYGASGVAYLFLKLSELAPKEEQYLKAYHYWIQQIPRNIAEENGFVGFRSFLKPESILFNLSYGWGVIGIGITLMRYLNQDLPNIDGINHGI